MLGAIHSIETFGLVDGPGVRYVIFMQGCHMRCKFCHNADTWKAKEPDQSAESVLKKALRYRPYWKDTGGITVSGGEPLLNPEIVDMILYANNKLTGDISCATNLSLITTNMIEKLANTRLKALRGYDYQPDNMATLLEKAKSAVEACRGYSEYASLRL